MTEEFSYQELDRGSMQLVTSVLLSRESDFEKVLAKELPAVARYLAEQQVRHRLPINLQVSTLIMAVAFIKDDPEKANVLLVDLLDRYQNTPEIEITPRQLADLYPKGWYDEESYHKRLSQVRDNSHPWSRVFGGASE